MIVAAGLTPAWQQILRFDSFALGEVNRAAEAHWCASGKVFNVGIALARLGAEHRLIAPVGNDVAARVEREFVALGVAANLVHHNHPTRVCTTLLDTSSGTVTELVENAPPLGPECLATFVAAFAEAVTNAAVVTLSGSLTAAVPAGFYRDLLRGTSGRAVVDARGPELLAALECGPFLVKPNRDELARSLARPLDDEPALIAAMREINRRGAQWVVVTSGRRAIWASSPAGVWRFQPLQVPHVVNPIGCGDCLTAGLAWGLAQGRPSLDCIRIGIAAAAQNAAQLLPARLNPREALEQSRQVQVESL